MQKKVNQYLINLSILFITWGGLFRRSFNSDTLAHMINPENSIFVQIQDGRYLLALTDYILMKLGLSATTHTGVTVIFGLLCLALGLCYVQKGFQEKIKQTTYLETLGFIAITALLFSNVLFGETLMFGECVQAFGLGYLFASMGIYYFIKKRRGLAFVLFLMATTGYQVTVVYAAIVLSAYVFIDNDYRITMKTVTEEVLCGLMTFGSGLLNLTSQILLAKIGISRGMRKSAGSGDMMEKLGEIADTYAALLKNSDGVLPNVWLPLLIMIFCAGIILYGFIKKKDGKACIYFILLFMGINAMIFGIPLLQAYIYLPPRIIWTFYAVQSMLLLIGYVCLDGKMKTAICYAGCGYLLIQIIFCNVIIANRTLSNSLDTIYANMVYEKILDYEAETGTEVTKLAVVNDTDCPFSYNDVHYKTDQINERALGTVTNSLMNVVSGKKFEKIPMDNTVYETYFTGKNWDYFDASEQLIIQGDTAYWAIF